ncbi:MAG TPA: hypothetical protein VGL66_07425 [Caulobacteraceae bacterium]|jgi:hypothetical protein
MRILRTVIALAVAALLPAGGAAAWPSLPIPGLKHKDPASATPTPAAPATYDPGVYRIYQSDTDVYLVDTTTIGDIVAGRRQADVYVLDSAGANHRDLDDFDCARHTLRRTGGSNFQLSAKGDDVAVVKAAPWMADHVDPDRSVIRLVEDFVCRWPKPDATKALVRISDVPDDEHARLILFAQSAPEFFRK